MKNEYYFKYNYLNDNVLIHHSNICRNLIVYFLFFYFDETCFSWDPHI